MENATKTVKPLISVVICFKDWGLDRLLGVVESIHSSHLGDLLEIIVADYGSVSTSGYEDKLKNLGAQYFYFETDGVWSRSRALNLGLREAKGKYLVATDADMIFTPQTFPTVLRLLQEDGGSYYIVQCRDLPEGIKHRDILEGDLTWAELESIARLRPRWGMGGLIAFPRSAYYETRGLDERLEVYGGEDIDLAKRLMRVGLRRCWIPNPEVRMYHVWHPSSLAEAEGTQSGRKSVVSNRKVHLNDASIARNLSSWKGRPRNLPPLVTVAISTFNRAEFLRESIASVLAQSFQDFELIVVDDGSTDETVNVLKSIKDPRVRYVSQSNQGLAAARNRITDLAQGKYLAVHDDDDIMLPDRLKNQISAVGSGVNGTYGGWINFDNYSGELDFNRGKRFSQASLTFNKGIYLHPTLLVETELLKQVPYDASMRSGSDYNLAMRLARVGANLVHSGRYVLLRRTHLGQITSLHGDLQKVSGRLTGGFGRASMDREQKKVASMERPQKDWIEVENEAAAGANAVHYMPDHISQRDASFHCSPEEWDSHEDSLTTIGAAWIGTLYTAGNIQKKGEIRCASLLSLLELHRLFGERVTVQEPSCEDRRLDKPEVPFGTFLGSNIEGLGTGIYLIGSLPESVVETATRSELLMHCDFIATSPDLTSGGASAILVKTLDSLDQRTAVQNQIESLADCNFDETWILESREQE